MARNTWKYHYKQGNRIVHTSITNDLERREARAPAKQYREGHIKQVGTVTTRDVALKWEGEQTGRGNPTRQSSISYPLFLIPI